MDVVIYPWVSGRCWHKHNGNKNGERDVKNDNMELSDYEYYLIYSCGGQRKGVGACTAGHNCIPYAHSGNTFGNREQLKAKEGDWWCVLILWREGGSGPKIGEVSTRPKNPFMSDFWWKGRFEIYAWSGSCLWPFRHWPVGGVEWRGVDVRR